jgi:hypothetical protein
MPSAARFPILPSAMAMTAASNRGVRGAYNW